ncbi:titin homolog [Plutella xylostella]|uniref:titin homolog n=1 Tax=Plutella xylostella TaxID=51655 RepID=UPI00203302C9|nr:titin homolog [Plutella xylostella]
MARKAARNKVIHKVTDKSEDKEGINVGDKVADKDPGKAEDNVGDLIGDIIKDKVKNKVGRKVTDKVEDKVADIVGDKIVDVVGDKVADVVGDKAGDKIKDKAKDKIKDKTGDKIKDKVGDKVEDKVGDKVEDKVGDKVEDKAGDKVEDKVGDKVEDKGGDKAEEKDKRVKIAGEPEDDVPAEGEPVKKTMKRFQFPPVPRWWQAKLIQYAFAHPHVRARLEKHMGSHLARLTDQGYMSELEDRIRQLNEENLNKRISSRVLDEMERLKRLILVGKTPLKECPPELFYHPVFVFWRMVNREVARASKKRAEAYLKKLKATQKIEHAFDESSEGVGEEETAEFLTDEQILKNCQDEVEAQRLVDIENGFRFNEEEYAQLKYETSEIKTLKSLSSVEDLYALADKIIGSKRLEVK